MNDSDLKLLTFEQLHDLETAISIEKTSRTEYTESCGESRYEWLLGYFRHTAKFTTNQVNALPHWYKLPKTQQKKFSVAYQTAVRYLLQLGIESPDAIRALITDLVHSNPNLIRLTLPLIIEAVKNVPNEFDRQFPNYGTSGIKLLVTQINAQRSN